jgi:hypothetical protein
MESWFQRWECVVCVTCVQMDEALTQRNGGGETLEWICPKDKLNLTSQANITSFGEDTKWSAQPIIRNSKCVFLICVPVLEK